MWKERPFNAQPPEEEKKHRQFYAPMGIGRDHMMQKNNFPAPSDFSLKNNVSERIDSTMMHENQ